MHLKAIPAPPGELTEEVTHFVVQSVCPMISHFNPQLANLSFGNADENLVEFSLGFLDCSPCRWLLLFGLFGSSFSPGAVFLPPQQPVVQRRVQWFTVIYSDLLPLHWLTLDSGPSAGHSSLFAREANPSLQLQCRRGRADKNHLIVLPWDPWGQCVGEELLKVSFTSEQSNWNKRAVEASA